MRPQHFNPNRRVSALLTAAALGLGLCVPHTGRAAVFTVTNAADSGLGTLRWALTNANADATADVINFAIGSGQQTINLLSALPAIPHPVTLDGSTQPGYAGTPLVELNGTSAGSNPGLYITAGDCTVRGLVLNRFAGGGIRLLVGDSNTVQGCFIGTDITGTIARPNGEFGIWITSSSVGNQIGGTNAAQRNVISGNTKAGIYVAQCPNNVIQGNYIGLNASGTAALPNGNNGIVIDASNGVQVGGPEPGQGNVISGNKDAGIYVPDSNDTLVQGNLIGLSASGGTVLSNWLDGIRIEGGSGHQIGGSGSGAGNTISGNGGTGVFLQLADGCAVAGNKLGTDASGTAARGNRYAGITLEGSSNCLIGGTAAGARNLISGNVQDGAYLTNCSNTQIAGNWIGLDATGNAALANGFNGVTVSASSNITVGGVTNGTGNVISGNAAHGVSVREGGSGNTVAGNFVGLNATGTAARSNHLAGVRLASGSNLVGGATVAARNIISGNGTQGVSIDGLSASNNVIQGNRIGTTPSGTAALANGNAGIGFSGAPYNTVGGTAAGAGNLVSGNQDAGIFLIGAGAHHNQVVGNYIGTTANGSAAVPNLYEGVYLSGGASNTIGGASPEAGNLISGNLRGIFLTSTVGNLIVGNSIGIAADGATPLGNTQHAIELESGASQNLIGSTASGAGNRIGFSRTFGGFGYSGVRVRAEASGNAIRGNSIFSNDGLGIDLGAFQVTTNDNCDGDSGANLQQNFPVLTKAAISAAAITVQGDLNSASGQSYSLDFFTSPTADPSGYGEGELFLGSAQVSIPAGPSCSQHFVVGLAKFVPLGWVVTATATDAAGNTSEFSAAIATESYPALSIAALPSPTTVLLSWTNSATGYVLNTATNLVPPVQWTPLTNAPVSSNGQWNVTLPLDAAPQRYYRLGLP